MPKVKIQTSTAVFLLLLAVFGRDTVAFMPILAAAAHEIGHLAVMLLLRVPVREMEITLFGAEIKSGLFGVGSAGRAVIYFAGAGMNILTGVAAVLLFKQSFLANVFFVSSLGLGVLNLVPIRSLDGGKILEVICESVCPTRADRILNITSVVSLAFLWLTAVYLMLCLGGNISLLLFCMFMFVSLYLR